MNVGESFCTYIFKGGKLCIFSLLGWPENFLKGEKTEDLGF